MMVAISNSILINEIKDQIRVTYALMMRDAVGRYGHENIGFFWVIGEPLILSCSIMALWSIAHVEHGGEIGVVPFALTGYSFITMWRHITARSIGSIHAHKNLAYHRQVKPINIIVAIAILETIACFSAFFVAYIPLWLLDICPTMSDPLALIGGFTLGAVFALGFGLMLAGFSQLSEVFHHIVPAIMYVTIPLTGIFTMQAWLPVKLRSFMLWSPLVNAVEMFRGGLFPPEAEALYSTSYLAIISLSMLILGFLTFLYANKIHHT